MMQHISLSKHTLQENLKIDESIEIEIQIEKDLIDVLILHSFP
jgi:hypothetical protein